MESDVKHKELTQNLSGTVTDVFAHRFVVETGKGKILADLGPKAAERVSLKEGDHVELIGDMKPSELKIRRSSSIIPTSCARIRTSWGQIRSRLSKRSKPTASQSWADPAASRSISRFWAATRRGTWLELHVELDGSLRKTHPVQADDPKWATEIKVAR
jgi:hypothetical protein